jgi:CHAT domain-containing protein
MKDFDELHPIIRYPLYAVLILYSFTIHQIILILARIFFKIYWRTVRIYLKEIMKDALNAFLEDDFDKAISLCLKCIIKIPPVMREYFREHYNDAVLYLGSLYLFKGNFIEVERYLKEAALVIDENEFNRIILSIYEGDYYAKKMEFKKAEESYLQAYNRLSDFKESVYYKNLCFSLSGLYCFMSQFSLAKEYLDEGSRDSPDSVNKIRGEVDLLYHQCKFQEAEEKAQPLIEYINSGKVDIHLSSELLILLADLAYRNKRYSESISTINRAIQICQNINGEMHPLYGECLAVKGLALRKLKRFSEAKISFEKDLQLKLYFFGRISLNYLIAVQNMAQLYDSLEEIKECEKYYEELMDIYIDLIQKYYKEMSYDERFTLGLVHSSIYYSVFNYIAKSNNHSPSFLKKVFNFRVNTKMLFLEKSFNRIKMDDAFDKIRDILDKDDIVVEVLRAIEYEDIDTGRAIYIYFIISQETQNTPNIRTNIRTFKQENDEYYYYLANIKDQAVDLNSYDTYWKILTLLLNGKKNIFFSPSGVYQYFNINSLLDDLGRYLIEVYNIKYYNDIRNLVNRKSEKEKLPKRALLFANPIFYSEKVYSVDNKIKQFLPPITQTKEEVLKISSILQDHNCVTTIFCEDDVTKSNLASICDYQLLHVATHGYFGKAQIDEPDIEIFMKNSGLFLSNSAIYSLEENRIVFSEDGFLSSYDIINMEMRSLDLVVLSACKSGMGLQFFVEASFGLIHSLFMSGVGNCLVSMWEVEDSITKEFMTKFYTHWMQEQDKNSAFNKTQLEMLNKYRDPLYWGGFVLFHR